MRARRLLVAGLAPVLAFAVACSTAPVAAPVDDEIALRVGVLYTTGGTGGDLAQAVLGAANLAVEAAAKDGVEIELVDADYAGDLAAVPGAIARLRAESDAIVVATPDAGVATPAKRVDDLPVLYSFLGADGLVGDRANAFTMAPTDRLSAETIARFLVDRRRYTRVAVLTDTTAFGRAGADRLAGAFARAAITPVMMRTFAPGGDIHTPVMEAGGKNAEALVVWTDSPSEAARVVVEAHRVAQSYQIVLSGNLATATFAKNASAQVTPVAFRDGLLAPGTWGGPWFPLERMVGFYRDFQTANSALAPPSATAVYDAILALAAAARAGGVEPPDLIAGLESLTDFEGAGVPITFSAGDHEGIEADDMAMLGYTKNQDSAGGEFFPEVDTGGGFFTIVSESLDLPERYRFLVNP